MGSGDLVRINWLGNRARPQGRARLAVTLSAFDGNANFFLVLLELSSTIFLFYTPRSKNRSRSSQIEKPDPGFSYFIYCFGRKSPDTSCILGCAEKAETRRHKSNLRGSPLPHLPYPSVPLLDYLYSS